MLQTLALLLGLGSDASLRDSNCLQQLFIAPDPFARKTKYRECSIRQVTSKKKLKKLQSYFHNNNDIDRRINISSSSNCMVCTYTMPASSTIWLFGINWRKWLFHRRSVTEVEKSHLRNRLSVTEEFISALRQPAVGYARSISNSSVAVYGCRSITLKVR